MKLKLIAGMVWTLAAATLPCAASEVWEIDTKHSMANFSIKHMMVSNVRGQIGGITGVVHWDGKNIEEASVKAELDPATISTNEAKRDEHLRGPDFFDVKTYPKITFESTGAIAVLDAPFKLGGKLTMHGVTRPVELTVDGPTEPIKDPQGNLKIGAVGTTTINRKDFGITYNTVLDNGGVAIGDQVKITIDLELVKRKEDGKKSDK